jgi:hypothetical protein
MNEGDNKQMNTPEMDDWKERYTDLSRQLAMLRAAVLVASLTLTAYLFVQNRRTGKDVEALRSNVQQIVDGSKKEGELMSALAGKLLEYGQTHPDFQPILNRYGIKAVGAPAPTNRPATPGATLPLPTATPPKK